MNMNKLFDARTQCNWCTDNPKLMGEQFCSHECENLFYEDFVSKLVDEDEDKDEEVPLCDMNDKQIEKYVEQIGRCPREECDEWAMIYTGGIPKRYSYGNFTQWGIEDQTVSNITITRAIFDEINFDNCTFDNVIFEDCVFKDIRLNNTTIKNSTFDGCYMDPGMVADDSCRVIPRENEYDHFYARYEDEGEEEDEDEDMHRHLY